MVTAHGGTWTFLTQQVGNYHIDHEGNAVTFLLLPNGGFFTVSVWPAEGPEPPVRLLYSFKNLYLLGFSHQDIWYVYDDADLTGSGYSKELHEAFLVKLRFSGGYKGNMFETVSLGIVQIESSYQVLRRCLQHTGAQVQTALYRFIVVLPEAWRFPVWNTYLVNAFSNCLVVTVDNVGGLGYSNLFQKWSKICRRILGGPDEFHTFPPLIGYPEYANLLPEVSALLN